MPFSPDRFQAVARKLKNGVVPDSGEERHRTMVGRSYYAAYLSVCVAIYKHHRIGPEHKYPGHELLADELARVKTDDELKRIGGTLNTLRLRRLHADYTLDKQLLEDTADDSVDDADTLLNLLTPEVISRLPRIVGERKDQRY